MKKTFIALFVLLTLCSFSICANATILDQSFIGGTGGLGANINEGFMFVGQSFTCGLTGNLDGINIDVSQYAIGNFNLVVDLFSAQGGLPDSNLLDSTVLSSGFSPISSLITFSNTINMISGNEYAIVVSYLNATPGAHQGIGTWRGEPGNNYSGGNMFFGNDGTTWFSTNHDVYFQTYINPVPEPTTFLLLGSGLLGLVGLKKKRKSV